MKPSLSQDTEALIGKQLFEHAPIGLAVSLGNTVFVRVNPAFCRFLGYSKQELLGKTVRDVTHPDDWATSAKLIRKFRSTRKPTKPFEKRYRHKNGQAVWGEVSLFVIRDDGCKTHCTMAQVVDITERKEAEEALRLSNERFRVALAGSPITVFTQDRDLRYTWAYNPVSPVKLEDFLGKTDSDIFNSHEAKKLMRIKWEVMRTGVGRHDEVVLHACDDEKVFDAMYEPLRDASGKIAGVICAAIDITDRKLLEESLEQKVKDRTARLRQLTEELVISEHRERRRIADVLHEQLQQNLCGLKYRASQLKDDSSTPAMIDWADQQEKGLDDAIQLTRTLTTDLHPTVLSHLGIREAMEWLATDVNKKMGLSITVITDKRVPMIKGELKMFVFEAARELLLNVVKHAKVKTAKLLFSSMDANRVKLQVRDKGVGFDPKQNGKEINHFGLFRIQERAESFGGDFQVVSQPNNGTCVTLILPRR